ncbi:MAG: dihydrolipoamide acetyltransferase family protein [Pirellulales bacterium]
MAIEVKLPDLGEGIKSGDVLDILVKAGDDVTKGQGLIEIETDKATVEVPSPAAGKVVKVLVSQGQSIPIGATIVELESAGAAAPAPAPAPAAPAAQPTPPPQSPSPPVAQTSVASAPASPGPAPAPVTAPPAARPVSPPPVIAPAAVATSPVVPAAATAVTDTAFAGAIAPAGPAIRRLAREVGVDLSQVVGTGPGGRITREDVMAVVRQSGVRPTSIGLPPVAQPTATSSSAAPAVDASTSVAGAATGTPAVSPTTVPAATPTAPPAAPATGITSGSDAWGPVEIERAPKIRRTIAARMTESWTTVPRVTNFDDADVTELERVRQASKADYAAAGVKLTSLPFVIKAVALSLRHHPLLNASFDIEQEQIIYKKYINVGVAVDTDRGLVVPALRHADQMGIPEMARALAKITESARTNSFTVDDLRGSTFTISNLGAIGGTYSTPIVNTPEVAILLVGRSRKLPVVVDDQVVVRLMMPLSLSYDHRLVDGGAAARFLNDVIGYLEAPSRLFLAP